MTSSRRRKLAAITTYEQRRRRLRATGDHLPPAQLAETEQQPQSAVSRWRDSNNNDPQFPNETPARRYYVGAIVYKRPLVNDAGNSSAESNEFALHLFEQHKVQVRHNEPESRVLHRISNEYSAIAKGKSTFINSIYLMQKFVPTSYSNQSLFEVDSAVDNPVKQIHQVNLLFKRKYIAVLMHEHDPTKEAEHRETNTYLSSVFLNV